MTLRASFAVSIVALNLLLAVAGAAEPGKAEPEEFRIENKVFMDNAKEPHAESTTIFHRGMVYDYLKKPAEVTILDKARGRFVLLDMTRRVETEIPTDKVAAFTEGLRRWAVAQSDPFLQFLADPKFEEEFDETSGQWTFTSPWMTYRLTTIATGNGAMARQYREFSDWHCQLNALLTPGARPPFGRMAVNAALEKRQRFPNEAQLTARTKKGIPPKKVVLRSEHQLVRRLVESDRDRVAQTDQFIAIYRQVPFEEYQSKIAEQ